MVVPQDPRRHPTTDDTPSRTWELWTTATSVTIDSTGYLGREGGKEGLVETKESGDEPSHECGLDSNPRGTGHLSFLVSGRRGGSRKRSWVEVVGSPGDTSKDSTGPGGTGRPNGGRSVRRIVSHEGADGEFGVGGRGRRKGGQTGGKGVCGLRVVGPGNRTTRDTNRFR